MLRALLPQSHWRSADNLSDSAGVSAGAMPRFLTGARRSDDTVNLRLGKSFPAPGLRPHTKITLMRAGVVRGIYDK